MVDQSLQGIADKATDSDAFEYAARAGFAVSGALHLLVAYITLQIAFGSGGNATIRRTSDTRRPDRRHIDPLGRCGAGWLRSACGGSRKRSSAPNLESGPETGTTTPQHGSALLLGLAIVNLAIAFSAARFAMGSGQQSSQQNAGLSAQSDCDPGKAVLILVGLGLAAVGATTSEGASKKFLKDLRVSGGTGITAVGVTGYVAKGVVLAGAGVLVIIATLQADPSEATAAIKTLGNFPFGKVLLVLAALGVAAFGVYSFVRRRGM